MKAHKDEPSVMLTESAQPLCIATQQISAAAHDQQRSVNSTVGNALKTLAIQQLLTLSAAVVYAE
jgi:hypothetical protein